MKQLPGEYLESSVKVIGEANKSLSNQNATKQIIVQTVYNDGTGKAETITYNVGVLTGVIGENESGVYCVQFLHDGKLYWTSENGLVLSGVNNSYNVKAQDKATILIQDNEAILEDLLLASEFVARLEKKGINCNTYRTEIKSLYNRLQRRNSAIEQYCTIEQYTQPKLLSDSLQKIISGAKIAELATATIIIISVGVTAVFSALAWYTFYTYGAEARSDCRKSKELNKILANVDPETKEQLYSYIDQYADSYYKKAVARTKASNLFSNIKNVALFGGALFLSYKLFNNKES